MCVVDDAEKRKREAEKFATWWCSLQERFGCGGGQEIHKEVVRLVTTRECLDDGDSEVLAHFDTWMAAIKANAA